MEVHARELSIIKMTAGNESKYSFVIDNGILKQWVAIGWVDIGPATIADKSKYPSIIRSPL